MKVVAISLGLALLLPIGTLVAYPIATFPPTIIAGFLSFGLIALLYLVTEELLVEAHEKPDTPPYQRDVLCRLSRVNAGRGGHWLTHRLTKRCATWTAEADIELRDRISARQGIGEIAIALGRTADSIRSRATHLPLILPSRIRQWRRGMPRPWDQNGS